MFPLQKGDELCFKAGSNSIQQHKILQDRILSTHAVLNGSGINDTMVKSRQRKLMSMDNNSSKKKMMHRDIERQRRQEMTTLYASLRSLLPLEFIKGKRSISDHMNQSVNYIKHLQEKIKELSLKRDELKKLTNLSSFALQSETSIKYCSPTSVMVQPFLGGIEIVFNNGLRDEQGLPLSKVLQVLLAEGITVVNCVSTKVNDRLFHTIQTEVNDPTCLNLDELQRKLTSLVPSSSDDISK